MVKLILLRHGQSVWNKKNIFTGWIDVPLSQEGMEEAIRAGKALQGYDIDVVYVSSLIRAQMTAFIAMAQESERKVLCVQHEERSLHAEWYKATSEEFIPVYIAWELNERMYGELQGKNKQEMREKYGEKLVQLWRRSYDQAPPGGESLKETKARTIPFFEQRICQDLQRGLNVLVCAHGNSLRSIVMDIEQLTEEQVLELEIATGVPRIYEYQAQTSPHWQRQNG